MAFIFSYRPSQKLGVSNSSTPKSSRRPISIINDNNHFAKSGSALHENAGPKAPSPGPTLPILKVAEQVYVLADSSKFGGGYVSVICPIQDVYKIITDSDVSRENIKKAQESNISLVIA